MAKSDDLIRAYRLAGRYLLDERLHVDHLDIRDTSVSLWCDPTPEAIHAGWEYAQSHEGATVHSAPKKDKSGWWCEVFWQEDGFGVGVWSDIDDPDVIERVAAVKQECREDYARIVAAIVQPIPDETYRATDETTGGKTDA